MSITYSSSTGKSMDSMDRFFLACRKCKRREKPLTYYTEVI